jgi:hypothetical protein
MTAPAGHQGSIALTRPRRGGDLTTLRRILWRAVLAAEKILVEAPDDEMRVKGIHATIQACGAYCKLLADTELEQRLQALEQASRGQA